MRMIGRSPTRAGRILIISLGIALFAFLVVLDGAYSIPGSAVRPMAAWLVWVRFGFSAFVAFTFFMIGSLVYLFARNRLVAWLLFAFSFTMMVTFATETASVMNNRLFLGLSSASSSLALAFFAFLLLFFPRNLVARSASSGGVSVQKRWHGYSPPFLRAYFVLLTVLCVMSLLDTFIVEWSSLPVPLWLTLSVSLYHLIVLIGILTTIGISYSQHSSLRERQQQRIFVAGVILSFAPLLALTVFPYVLNMPRFIVDPQLSTLTIILLPLALGYTILRYQVLVFDRYIRRAVAAMMGIVGLFAVGYLVIMLSNLLLPGGRVGAVIFAVVVVGVMGPGVWWIARVATEHFFFSEMRHYRRLIDRVDIMSSETFGIDEAARLLSTAALQVFETEEVCLFVLDDDSGHFRLYPALNDDESQDIVRRTLGKQVLDLVESPANVSMKELWLKQDDALVEKVASVNRPMLYHEIARFALGGPTGVSRYISATGPMDHTDPLVAPIWAHGNVIGLLVLGERSDHQQYAGPDFDAVHYLLARFSPPLEAARLYLKLRAAYERQKELDQLKDLFITTASHELRTPLTAVQGYIELLANFGSSLDAETQTDFLAKAQRSCDELTLLVNNIMDASLIESEVEQIKRSAVTLSEAVQSVLEMLEGNFAREQRTVNVHIPGDLSVLADSVRLRQVLLNLLTNALKFSEPGSGVDIAAFEDDDQITITIRDYGLGVPLTDQEHLFERFMRLERDMNSPVRGAGLGLYISKRLIEAMRGRIWVESRGVPGQGSTFAFSLKRAKVTRQEVPSQLEHQQVS